MAGDLSLCWAVRGLSEIRHDVAIALVVAYRYICGMF